MKCLHSWWGLTGKLRMKFFYVFVPIMFSICSHMLKVSKKTKTLTKFKETVGLHNGQRSRAPTSYISECMGYWP
jgi:hypothetical protein